MKVLFINGSPHQKGTTFHALNEVEKILNEQGIETIWCNVPADIPSCMACNYCHKERQGCIRKDAVNDCYALLDEADGLIVGSQVWKGMGWGTILYFAALTGVNPELYEAAKIDGAGPITRTRVVTWPAIVPVITFSLIMSLGSILNNDFEQIIMYYNSAVYSVGDIIESWVYRVGLGSQQYSTGAAVSLLKAVISMVLIIGANSFSRKVAGRGMW